MAKRTKRPSRPKQKSTVGKARTRVLRKPKRASSGKAKKPAKRTTRRVITKARRSKRTPTRQRKQAPELVAAAVETTIVDVIEEPLPGVVAVTEVEAQRVALADSDEEDED
jgi:hypothetical protein